MLMGRIKLQGVFSDLRFELFLSPSQSFIRSAIYFSECNEDARYKQETEGVKQLRIVGNAKRMDWVDGPITRPKNCNKNRED